MSFDSSWNAQKKGDENETSFYVQGIQNQWEFCQGISANGVNVYSGWHRFNVKGCHNGPGVGILCDCYNLIMTAEDPAVPAIIWNALFALTLNAERW